MKIEYLADCLDVIPTLSGWHHKEWLVYNPGESMEERVAKMTAQAGKGAVPTTFVAIEDGTVLGSASLVAHDMDTRMDLSPWLASVLVAPEHRRRGVGTTLVNRVVDEARALGFRTLYLFTPDKEAFYKKLGWQFLERTEYMTKSVVVMSLSTTD